MVFTVTLNPAIDKTVVIPGFQPGKVNRIQSLRADAGGKGINVSKCLKQLSVESVAAGIFAGSAGDTLLAMLDETGISTLSVSVAGQSRTNTKIIDPEQKLNTDINEPGPQVPAQSLTLLRDEIGRRITPGDAVVLSGSLPAGAPDTLYRDWIACFRDLGAKVFLDADGAALVQGVQASPWLVKPNDAELSRLVGRNLETREDLRKAGEALLKTGIREVVISLGGEGALFLSEETKFQAKALKVPVQSTVGAGDSMVAAMVCGYVNQLPRENVIRLAVAMGAASCMCDGSQAPDGALVHRLAEQVEIAPL